LRTLQSEEKRETLINYNFENEFKKKWAHKKENIFLTPFLPQKRRKRRKKFHNSKSQTERGFFEVCSSLIK